MKTYQIEGLTLRTRLPIATREFVSWANVWLLAQTLIVFHAIEISAGMPIQWLVTALGMVWLISVVHKI